MKKAIAIAAVILGYGVIAAIIVYFAAHSGAYPDGSDTMFYVYREDALYHSIVDEGVWYPLWDANWYNGVQISRYWAPICTYLMAGCEALCNGNPYNGYLLFVGIVYLVGAVSWFKIGLTHGRPALGAIIGALWGLLPNNVFQFYTEGVLVRCLILAILPLYIEGIYDYLYLKKWKGIPEMLFGMVFMVGTHLGYAGMVALATVLFAVVFMIVERSIKRPLPVLMCVISGMLLTGIWLYPSLVGGITSKDSSSIMAMHFQPLSETINPFRGIVEDRFIWNGEGNTYFGIVLFVVCIIGILFAKKKSKTGFIVAFVTVLLTTNFAYPFLSKMPGGQFLWMLRFVSIALCFALMSFLFWDSLRKTWIILICALLIIESVPSWRLIGLDYSGITAEDRYDATLEVKPIGYARDITAQRLTVAESIGTVDESCIYLMAGYQFGEKNKPIMLGQGVQGAVTYENIVQLNQALEDGCFLYYFDRCLELGTDTVLISMERIKDDEDRLSDMEHAAKAVGFNLVEENNETRVYHYPVKGNWGVKTTYTAIGIGTSAPMMSLNFPMIEETRETNLNKYTYEELSKYKTIYLAGFTYTDKKSAENMIKKLADNGTRIVIIADGIPVEQKSGVQNFLGATCHKINFTNGYPELYIRGQYINADLFPQEYADWKTVYINGLDDEIGTFEDSDQNVCFLGTKYSKNIVFLGLNLSYQYALTGDETVGEIIGQIFKFPADELPYRKIVPLDVEYNGRGIKITSPEDKVNTTFAYHDIFVTDEKIADYNNLLVVDSGTTTIKFRYPCLFMGLLLSGIGLFLTFITLTWTRQSENFFIKKKVKTKSTIEELKEAISTDNEPKEKTEKVDISLTGFEEVDEWISDVTDSEAKEWLDEIDKNKRK